MAEKSAVEFIEEWQTGVMLLLGCAMVGIVVGAVLGSSSDSGPIGLLGFFGGAILAFLTASYVLYGR